MKDRIHFIAQVLVERPAEIEVEAGRGGGISLAILGPPESGTE